jgi:hypothetical protein
MFSHLRQRAAEFAEDVDVKRKLGDKLGSKLVVKLAIQLQPHLRKGAAEFAEDVDVKRDDVLALGALHLWSKACQHLVS